jgi:hypothetical protein
MAAGASAGLPSLPADFWTAWPNSAGDANWTPIGAPQTIANLDPLRPTVLSWSWTPPPGADAHSSILVVVDSTSDPIPGTAKVFDVAQLVTSEKRVGLKNLQLVNLAQGALVPVRVYLYTHEADAEHIVRIPSVRRPQIDLGILLSKSLSSRVQSGESDGLTSSDFSTEDLDLLRHRWIHEEMRPEVSWDRLLETFDATRLYRVDPRVEYVDVPLGVTTGNREEIILLSKEARGSAPVGAPASFTIQQLTSTGEVVGGITFVFRPAS